MGKKSFFKVSACHIFVAIVSIISITATISNTVIVILVAVHWLSDFSDPRIIINKTVLNHPYIATCSHSPNVYPGIVK